MPRAPRRPLHFQAPAMALAMCCFAPWFPSAALAQTAAALPQDYSDMVSLYAAGDANAALWQLSSWTEGRVRRHVADLSDAVVSIRKCPSCATRLAFSRFPIRAALLLHADREVQQQLNPPQSEQVPVCGSGPQATAVEHLAAILLLVDPEAGPFVKRAYLGMAGQAMWSHCFGEAAGWARSGLKHFPKDPSLLLAEGVAAEARAFFTMAPAPPVMGLTPASLRKREALKAELRDLRESARQSFEEAASADPNLVEARLRLGRVLWRLGRPEPARAAFEAVLAKYAEAPQQYLAHLFLGRILEDRGELAGAEEHYRQALAMQPLSEIAAVAVSHARFLQGDVEEARHLLSAGLEAVRTRRDFDPWMSYLLPQTPGGERILAELRQSISK
jgi:tetratricopeptide (TPR) repeat protein